MSQVPLKGAKLQSNLDANNWTIINLDLTGLGLTKSSVGLGNVDNTSDLLKPVSNATQIALNLKEPIILAGTTAQYWRGDKTWQTLGALALQAGATTLQELSVRTANTTGSAFVAAKRNDYSSSFAGTYIQHYGAAAVGTTIGLSNANLGELVFQNAAFAVIRSNGATPLVFGYNGFRRMRLMQGLNVGGDGDPGAGCISAFDTINTGHLLASDIICSGPPGGGNATFNGNLVVGGNANITGGLTVGGINASGNISTTGDFTATGFLLGRPPHFANADCPNDTVFYSTTDSKMSYKSALGVVTNFY